MHCLILCIMFIAFTKIKCRTSPFTCLRPFSSLNAFKSTAMNPVDNCAFDFLLIQNATVVPYCKKTYDNLNKTINCFIHIRLTGERYIPIKRIAHNITNFTYNDEARYTISIRALNHSIIKYKGYDNKGFSVCCDLLTNSECYWSERKNSVNNTHIKEQHIKTCPLFDDFSTNSNTENAVNIIGTLDKPLHAVVLGPYDLIINFYSNFRKKEVGKLKIPFRLKEAHLDTAQEDKNQYIIVSNTTELTSSSNEL